MLADRPLPPTLCTLLTGASQVYHLHGLLLIKVMLLGILPQLLGDLHAARQGTGSMKPNTISAAVSTAATTQPWHLSMLCHCDKCIQVVAELHKGTAVLPGRDHCK